MTVGKICVIALLCAISLIFFASHQWTVQGTTIVVGVKPDGIQTPVQHATIRSEYPTNPHPTRFLLPGMGNDDPPEPPEEFFKRPIRGTKTCLEVFTCAHNPPKFPEAFRAIDEICPSNYSGPTTDTFDAAAVVKAGPPFESPFFEPLNETALRDNVLCYGQRRIYDDAPQSHHCRIHPAPFGTT